jgi:uncharacterized integral membrane protein
MADQKPDAGKSREAWRIGAALVLIALVVAFVIDNTRYAKVGFVFFDHRTRVIYVLIVTFLLGVVVDRLWQRRHRG